MAAALAKTPKNIFLFRLPKTVRPDTVQVRYLLTGKFGGYAGWQSNEHEDSVSILTFYQETPAAALKAIVFSPACEPERVVVDDLRTSSREYVFQCRQAAAIDFKGKFPRPPEWQPLRVQVSVEYVAPWANQFLGVTDGATTTVSIADVSADASGRFQLSLPVIGKDGNAPDGAFTFVLRETTSGNVLGVLTPPEALRSAHGMKAAATYSDPVDFTLQRNR